MSGRRNLRALPDDRPDDLDELVAAVVPAAATNGDGQPPPAAPPPGDEDAPEPDPTHVGKGDERPESPFVDWSKFWNRDRRAAEWLYEDVLARGRGHALFAGHKAGKSLLTLFVAVTLATGTERVVVVYLDYEMGEDDLFERLADMGYGPETDMSRLCYGLLPTLPPLDSKAGADELDRILDDVARVYPDHHVAVIIDTMGRAVDGEENSADTFRAFYNHTGIRLKRRECTWVRLDHAGKDKSKGQRGSSGKGDDVDVVWDLRGTENGVELRRHAARMSWVPERATFAMRDDPLRYLPVRADWPDGTREVARALDRLDVPIDASTRDAQRVLRDAGEGKRREVVAAAMKWRREAGNHPGNHLRDTPGNHPGNHRAETA